MDLDPAGTGTLPREVPYLLLEIGIGIFYLFNLKQKGKSFFLVDEGSDN